MEGSGWENHLFLWAMAYHGYVSHNQRVTDAPVEEFNGMILQGGSSTGCFIVHTDGSFGSLIASHCLRSISNG